MSRGAYDPLSARDGLRSPLLDPSALNGDASPPSGPSLLAPTPRYPQPGFPPIALTSTPNSASSTLPSYLTALPLSLPTLHLIHANTGLLLVASSQIFFVCMGLSAKYFISSTSLSTLTLIFVRMGITALISIAWLSYTGNPNPVLGPPDPKIRRLLIMRGVFGFGGLFGNYQSLRGLSLSDSVTIQFLAPNLTALMGWLVLGEKLGWREVAAGLACLGGVVLVSRPPFLFGVGGGGAVVGPDDHSVVIPGEGVDAGITHADRMIAVGWAFVSVTFATCAYISIRKIGKQAHAMHSMLYFCYACLITSFIGLVVQFRSFVFLQTWNEFWLIMLIGAFGFFAQILLTFGLQREKAGRASLAMYLSLFYSLVFELVLFGTVPPFLSLLGAFIIISSAIWVALSKKNESGDSETANRYERVNTDEESLAFSRTPSPLPADGSMRRGESFDYSGGANGVTRAETDEASAGIGGVSRVNGDPQGKQEEGESKKGAVQPKAGLGGRGAEKESQLRVGGDRQLLRRKSSASSHKGFTAPTSGNKGI